MGQKDNERHWSNQAGAVLVLQSCSREGTTMVVGVSCTMHHAPLLLPAGAILLAQGPQHQQRRWQDLLPEHRVLSTIKMQLLPALLAFLGKDKPCDS